MAAEPDSRNRKFLPALVFLSGNQRGISQFLDGDRLRLGYAPDAEIQIAPDDVIAEPYVATLERRGQTYEIKVASEAEVLVNGEPVDTMVLASGDVLELATTGIVLRFRLYPADRGPYKTMAEAFSDCVDCARYGGENVLDRAGIFITGMPRELATQTAPRARVGFLVMAFVLVGAIGALWFRSVSLERRLAQEFARVDGLAELIEQAESNTFTRQDFEAARSELEGVLSDTSARVESLEALAGAPERVIASGFPAVVFLQGAYGFIEPASGRPLRYLAGPNGRPLRTGDGRTPVTLEGDGPLVEIFYTGTGFVATNEGYLLTNRHVALPWEYERSAQATIQQGFQPIMRRMIGYLPEVEEPFDVELIAASDNADVALLRCQAPTAMLEPLGLTETLPDPGDEVIVLGYPAGMRALMARAGVSFAEELQSRGPLDFWGLARGLSRGGHIEPLATQGIVGQVTAESVVYDAQTTHGGSGGPVLGLDGKVVAVNSAIVPDFGGSNLGVPAREALRLLAAAQQD